MVEAISPDSQLIFLDASSLKPLTITYKLARVAMKVYPIIRKDKSSSSVRRMWKNVEECTCFECYSYDYN